MKPDYDSLINAGLSKEEIAKISGCEDQGMQTLTTMTTTAVLRLK